MNPFRILVVDDHAVVRAGIRQFLLDVPDMQVAAEAASAVEAIRCIRDEVFDAVLLDISMPDTTGVDALKQIKRERPTLPVLVVSMHPESRYAVQLLRNGAAGYMQKEMMAADLVGALRQIVSGRRYINENVAELLARGVDENSEKPLHELLSQREYQVFMEIAQGRGVTEIAKAMNLSVKTISTYRTRVMHKLRSASNADLTYYAIKNGLVD
jgi:DNA-binding NarL/FixJ family response regulator